MFKYLYESIRFDFLLQKSFNSIPMKIMTIMIQLHLFSIYYFYFLSMIFSYFATVLYYLMNFKYIKKIVFFIQIYFFYYLMNSLSIIMTILIII
jgi:hypothetical protein